MSHRVWHRCTTTHTTCELIQPESCTTPVPVQVIFGCGYLLLFTTNCSTLISIPEFKGLFPFSATVADEIVQEIGFEACIHIFVDIQSTRGLLTHVSVVVLAL